MAGSHPTHWGRWVAARSQVVGFKRQRDFARAVGVSPQHLRRWEQMQKPPVRMRRGLDRALAWALNTTPRVLFVDYTTVQPEAAVRLLPFIPSDLPVDWTFPPGMFDLASLLWEVTLKLYPSEREKVAEYAVQLVLAKNDMRRAEFERLQQQLGVSARPAAEMASWDATAAHGMSGKRMAKSPRKNQ